MSGLRIQLLCVYKGCCVYLLKCMYSFDSCLWVCIISFLFLSLPGALSLTPGYPEPPGIGEYCLEYFNGATKNYPLFYFCYDCYLQCCNSFLTLSYCQSASLCPWGKASGQCVEVIQGYYYDGVSYGRTDCYAGCRTKAACTPIVNAVFTSSGVPGNATSCEFKCNTGFYQSGPRSCTSCFNSE